MVDLLGLRAHIEQRKIIVHTGNDAVHKRYQSERVGGGAQFEMRAIADEGHVHCRFDFAAQGIVFRVAGDAHNQVSGLWTDRRFVVFLRVAEMFAQRILIWETLSRERFIDDDGKRRQVRLEYRRDRAITGVRCRRFARCLFRGGPRGNDRRSHSEIRGIERAASN